MGVEALKEWSRARLRDKTISPHLERECYAATVSIALQFVRLLPNVRVLRFKANLTHELQLTFMAELLYQYFDQLTDVDYTGLAHFPEPVACPRLSTLRIELRPHDDQHLPVIDPCALKFISLTLFEMPFRWSYLKSGSDTDPVSFDRLERFDVSLIKADALAPVRSHIEHARFPRLASLRIPNTAFGAAEALLLADSPLRKLTLIGLPEHTDERCWQSLSRLDTLELDMGYVGNDEFGDGFIARTNSLFSKKQDIDRVQATKSEYPRCLIPITEQQCLGVEALKEWSRERIFHNDVTPHLERECYAATVSIALQFVRLLPNVRVLRFKANLTHELQLTFMAELLYQYFDQLTDVDYTGLTHFPEPVACPRLSTLRIELRPHDDQHLPVIDPCALKFISLTLFEMPFRWSYLKSGSDTNPVSFDRLERFDVSLIKADALAPVRSHIEHARFPRLASLRIPNTAFGTTEALLLADSPLRKLTLIGLPEHTDERCWQSLSQLDTLELDMGYVGSDEFGDGFIARTNSLFSKTQGIDRVQATFQSSRVFSSPDLNWLYVTHLDIAVFNGLVDAFMAVARMPNLTEMVVTVMRINEGDIANVLPFLQSLRHRYVPLTAIKLETLRLKFWLYARNNVPTEDFQALWWYYPTLRNLEIAFQ
ncbi:hypothetical protein H4R23_003862 [Coemansia sp. Cherry 401B]|nr:hypothetical protein H4R23_003862 [Coemansia sp. Cherry 401B]